MCAAPLDAAKNGNKNGSSNGDTNGDTNGSTNGDTNGSTNGDTKGSTNGSANGSSNGSTNRSSNGSANGGSTSGNLIGSGATSSSPEKIHLKDGWDVRGDYTIVGPTVLVIDGNFDIGNNTIDIAPTGSLELYVSGDITVNGNGGINNMGIPANLQAYGTQPMVEPTASPLNTWTLSGNGALSGVVYAPSVEYRTNGGGNGGYTSGSVVALDIRFNGSPGPFHFDEALDDLILPFGGYSMDIYELRKNGDYTPSDDAKEIFGSKDYATLFQQLYP